MTTTPERTLRVTPRVWLGLLAVVAYLVAFFGVWIINGIDYKHIGDNQDTLFKWYLAPLLAGFVVIVIIVSIYGWWRPALFETRKRFPGWIWIFGGLLAAAAIAGILTGDTSRLTPVMWLILTVGSLLVGFNEELVNRGQLIVALRSRFGELGVWFFSTLVFGLMHLPNTLFGTGVAGISQVGVTFLLGSAFYLLRRVGGTLIFAMILHGLWDFCSFAAPGEIQAFVGLPVGVASVIVAIVLTRRESREAKSAA